MRTPDPGDPDPDDLPAQSGMERVETGSAGIGPAEIGPVGTGPVGPSYRQRAVLVLAVAALAVLVLDLVTKQLAVTQLTDRGPVRLFGGGLYLVLTRNSGAAFSLARDYTFVFPVVTLVVVGWIAWVSRRLRSVPWGAALGLVLGGAGGNLVDRIFRAPGPFVGHVVDFLSLLDEHGQFFPVFNVADMALVSGVVLAILLELTGRRRDGTRHADNEDPDNEDPDNAGPDNAGPDDADLAGADPAGMDRTGTERTDMERTDTALDRVDARPGAGAPGRDHA